MQKSKISQGKILKETWQLRNSLCTGKVKKRVVSPDFFKLKVLPNL